MKTKTKPPPMFLTDDEVYDLFVPHYPGLAIRVRIWRGPDRLPVALVEPAGPDPIRPSACRICTFVRHCLMKGQDAVVVEHEPGGPWSLLGVSWVRHAACEATRSTVALPDLEAALGGPIPA